MSLPSTFAPSSHFRLPISHFKPSHHSRTSFFLSIDYWCCKSLNSPSRGTSRRLPLICSSSSDGASGSVPSDSDNIPRLVFGCFFLFSLDEVLLRLWKVIGREFAQNWKGNLTKKLLVYLWISIYLFYGVCVDEIYVCAMEFIAYLVLLMLFSNFCIIEGPETVQDFVQMQFQEIQDNIRSRRNKIFLLMEEVRFLIGSGSVNFFFFLDIGS